MRKNGKMFVRNGPLPANTAIQDYDVGTFIFAAAGTAEVVIGSIYITYKIRL